MQLSLHKARSRLLRALGPVALAAAVLCAGRPAPAGAETDHDGQLWFPLYATLSLTERVLGYAEVNPRYGNDVSEIDQLLLRPALGYQLTPTLSLWQGYAWITNYQPRFRDEHRLFQQALYTRRIGPLRVLSRTRFEQRWIRDARGTSLRAREMIRLSTPMPGSARWAFVLYDEIFVNVNDVRNGPASGLDQNRFFLGVNRIVTRHLNVDVGYQNQAINTGASGPFNRVNHVILIQTFLGW